MSPISPAVRPLAGDPLPGLTAGLLDRFHLQQKLIAQHAGLLNRLQPMLLEPLLTEASYHLAMASAMPLARVCRRLGHQIVVKDQQLGAVT